MNHDSDKEMDILLRRYTRRSASGLPGAKDVKVDAARTAHMDADELSAYAEGALPDASRLRYASHLADCDECRRIVTELVLSSSTETEESGSVAQAIEVRGRSWREWLAALFSPPMLRYAAPALALIAFASIVLVVVTRNREVTSFVSQQEPNRQQPANTGVVEQKDDTATTTAGTSDSPGVNRGVAANGNANGGAPASVAPAAQPQRKDENTTSPSIQTDGVSPSNSPKTVDGTESATTTSVQDRAEESKQTSQPVQSSPPNDTLADSAKEKDDAALAARKRRESNEVATGGAAPAGPTYGGRNRGTGTRNGALGATTETSDEERQKNQVTKSAPATAARSSRDASGADEDANAATRTVAGKRFRQQNGIWIDTSYKSSLSLVKVKRGSEQFRALAADEPVIGTVSNSFGGAVIVVVKGRAYHIY